MFHISIYFYICIIYLKVQLSITRLLPLQENMK